MALLAVATCALIEGVRVTTVDATNLSDSDMSDLLDRYNTYSGIFGSLFSLPFQGFVAVLLPLFLLLLTSRKLLSANDRSLVSSYAPGLLLVAIPLVLNQGMNALNVQFDPPSVQFRISAGDFTPTSINQDFPFNVTTVTNSAHTAGISSLDTIMRSAVQTTQTSSNSSCTHQATTIFDEIAFGSIRYAFPTASWLKNLLPRSVASDESFAFTMEDEFASGSIDSSALPGGDVNRTAALLTYAFWSLSEIFIEPYYYDTNSTESIFNALKSTDAADLLSNFQAVIDSTATRLANVSNSSFTAPDLSFWLNISVPEIVMELTSFKLSPRVSFEAVTFELPVKNESMQSVNFQPDENSTDWIYRSPTPYWCTDYACLLQNPSSLQDQVKLLPLCMAEANGTVEDVSRFPSQVYTNPCAFQSNASVMVVSVAHHVSVDSLNITYQYPRFAEPFQYMTLNNPRVTFSVTIGRLSWTTDDLAQVYNAECIAGADCVGLHFPLSTEKQHLVVGEAHIPSVATVRFPEKYKTWSSLVQASAGSASLTSDIIYPPTIPTAEGSIAWQQQGEENCLYYGSELMNNIIQRHIYSKDPVQAAYTAGLFWLFQNAVIKDVELTAFNKTSLGFDGNRKWISSRVSIPHVSALITFVGCLVIISIAVLIAKWTISRDQSQLSPHQVAGLMVNSSQYPTLFVRTRVNARTGDTSEDKPTAAPCEIHEFQITDITLRHRSDESTRTIASDNRDTVSADQDSAV